MTEQKIISADRQPDEVSIKQIILKVKSLNRYLINQWKVVMLFAIIGAGVGILYATLKKTVYTAECTFVLQEGSDQGSLGQYSAIASMVGIDIGGKNGLFQGDNIIELYKSRLMLEKTLLTQTVVSGKKQLLVDRYLEMNKVREGWKGNPKLKEISFAIPRENFTLQHDSIMSRIIGDISKNYIAVDKPDKRLSIISVKTKSNDELFAQQFTKALVANVNDFYIQTKTKGVVQNLKLLQAQSDSVRRVLNASIGGTASALDANPNPNPALQILRVPSQRRQIDVQANTAIYAEVVKNLEITRGMLQRETPLIQIIDQPVLPLSNNETGRLKMMIIGGIIGFFIGTFLIAVRRLYQKLLA